MEVSKLHSTLIYERNINHCFKLDYYEFTMWGCAVVKNLLLCLLCVRFPCIVRFGLFFFFFFFFRVFSFILYFGLVPTNSGPRHTSMLRNRFPKEECGKDGGGVWKEKDWNLNVMIVLSIYYASHEKNGECSMFSCVT
jgi:hypothetical protein